MTKITITRDYKRGKTPYCTARVADSTRQTMEDTMVEAVRRLIFKYDNPVGDKAQKDFIRDLLHNPEKFGVTLEFRGAKGQLVKPPARLRKK